MTKYAAVRLAGTKLAAWAMRRQTPGELAVRLPPGDLTLAIEHIESIRLLLQISSEHDQPVPHAVFVNLDLVLKNLSRLKDRSATEVNR